LTNVLLINSNCSWNKGAAAQVVSTTDALTKFASDATFSLISECPELDFKECRKRNIKVVGYSSGRLRKHRRALVVFSYHLGCSLLRSVIWRFLNRIGIHVPLLLNEAYCREYHKADIVLDLSGDSFSDKGARSPISILGILIALTLRKPVVIYSQSIGPFIKLTMPLAKMCLNKAHLITVREETSEKYLKAIGVNKTPVYQVADCAFALTPITSEEARGILAKEGIHRGDSPLVGVSVSSFIVQLAQRNTANLRVPGNEKDSYLGLMARLVDFLTESIQAQVVFVPHVIAPRWWIRDDRVVGQEIYRQVKGKSKVSLIKHDYTPQQLKGVIGQCDLFIGSRMHAVIAALSMHVPAIALGWSYKYAGIMERLGLRQYTCEYSSLTAEELISKVSDAWAKRKEIKEQLVSKIGKEKDLALLGAKLVSKLMDSLGVK
jgi:polysaccharide pyruvyl transferase WcaK-like protein